MSMEARWFSLAAASKNCHLKTKKKPVTGSALARSHTMQGDSKGLLII